MKNRKHRVLDHPIIGYFLLIVFVLLLTSLGSLIDSPISSFVSGIAGHEVGSGIGTAIGAVYLRTGNLWPCILGHMSLDFTEFIRGDLAGSDGVMVGMGVGDWITVVAAAVGAVLGLLMIRQKNCPQIMEVWSRKW